MTIVESDLQKLKLMQDAIRTLHQMYRSTPHLFTVCLLVGLFLSAAGCHVDQIKSPTGKQLILADSNQNCKAGESQRLWYLLFGGYLVNDLDEARLFKNSKSIRISKDMTWLDYTITILGGYAVTLHTHTITVQNCTGGATLVDAREQQARIDKILAKYASQQSENGRHPIVLLKDGSDLSGKIIEFNGQKIVLEIQKSESVSEAASNVVHLKNGQIIRGKVVSHSRTAIKIKTSRGVQSVLKVNIARINMNGPPLMEVEKKMIDRKEIKTILLQKAS